MDWEDLKRRLGELRMKGMGMGSEDEGEFGEEEDWDWEEDWDLEEEW